MPLQFRHVELGPTLKFQNRSCFQVEEDGLKESCFHYLNVNKNNKSQCCKYFTFLLENLQQYFNIWAALLRHRKYIHIWHNRFSIIY